MWSSIPILGLHTEKPADSTPDNTLEEHHHHIVFTWTWTAVLEPSHVKYLPCAGLWVETDWVPTGGDITVEIEDLIAAAKQFGVPFTITPIDGADL